MNDIARLAAAWDAGTLMHPASGPNLRDLALALARAGGADAELTPAAEALAERLGSAQHIVFALIDGLGMHLVDRLPDDAFFRRHLAGDLRSVYPSSTAPALTTLATGAWPGRHGVTGWWQYLPEQGITATILPFVERFSERPLEVGVGATAFPEPALMSRFARDTSSYYPQTIADSVYSRYSSGERPRTGYRSLQFAVEATASRITGAKEATFTYLYVPFVDAAQHHHGPHSKEAMRALREAQKQFSVLADRIGEKGRLIVTADHGLTALSRKDTWDRNEPLMSMLAIPPSGEPRALYFHTREGQRERFAAAFRERYGDAWALIEAAEGERTGLFGNGMSDATRGRIGDFIGVALTDQAILYEPSPELAAMQGFHGGMSPAEMRIPLIVA